MLSFASVCIDEDKLMFSGTAVSLNLNLGACFIKVKDYDRVGQLCSAVLCFDTTNVKAYFRRAIAALELNKPTLAFMDLAQALKIDPNNSKVNPTNQDLRPNVIDNNCVLKGTSETKNSNLTGLSFQFSSQKRIDSYLHLAPTMYGAISKGRTVQYYCSLQTNFITIRVANPLKKMDNGETQEGSTPMKFSHPLVEGHDRCETSPDLMQEDPAIGMASHELSCEATSTLLPISSVSSPLQTSVHPRTSSSDILLGFVSSPRPRLSGSKRIASCPTGYTWFPKLRIAAPKWKEGPPQFSD
uniref:Uncharacterized protein n=1 Tax=Chenopodium quinoa TaxID=63459 RepID=A0A803L394_CHEQI